MSVTKKATVCYAIKAKSQEKIKVFENFLMILAFCVPAIIAGQHKKRIFALLRKQKPESSNLHFCLFYLKYCGF